MKIIRVLPRTFRILYDGSTPEMVARASALAVELLERGFRVELEEVDE